MKVMNGVNVNDVEIPAEYICPITSNIMVQPMISKSSGHNFERSAICIWFKKNGHKCPVSGNRLQPSDLIPNKYLATQIKKWSIENQIPEGFQPITKKMEDEDGPVRARSSTRSIGDVFVSTRSMLSLPSLRSITSNNKETIKINAAAAKFSSPGNVRGGRRWSTFRKEVQGAGTA